MNKYIYSECPVDYWPSIQTLVARSYNDAVEKLIQKYADKFEDDSILEYDSLKRLREYLNDKYTFVISDLEDIEEL